LKPYRIADMKDDFQDVRLITEDADSCTVEITYHPLHQPAIGENARWREEYAAMTEYLRPTATENWDQTMQSDLLAQLGEAGIHPDRLSDRQLVEQVSRWAMRRSKSTQAFAIWTIHYPEGQAAVYPALRGAFDHEKSKAGRSEDGMFEQEALGRSTIGGIPALAAVLVVLTGILGSVIVTPLMNALRIKDFAARGFAVGVASHGIGTARAFQVSDEAGTFAGIAMGLNGALTALVFLLVPFFF
jgi:hypothetical protein